MSARSRRNGIGHGTRPTALRVGWTLPVALAAAFGTAGCRGDGTSPAKPPFIPDRWLQRTPPARESELKPVPEAGTYDAPPLPASPRRDAIVPPAPVPAPSPEPIDLTPVEPGADPFAFYGVRRTSGEVAVPPEPSWADRFRKLFFRAETSAAPAVRPLPPLTATGGVAPPATEIAELPPQPPQPVPIRYGVPATAVVLAPPVFESDNDEEWATTPAVLPTAICASADRESDADRLPAIRPGRAVAVAEDATVPDPAPWPHRAATETPSPAALPSPGASEDAFAEVAPPAPAGFVPLMRQAAPPELLPAPQTADADAGPALFR